MFEKLSITLASASPRRREILDQIKVPYSVCVPNIDESCDICIPKERVMFLATQKALAVLNKVDTDFIIAADTVVALPHTTATNDHSNTPLYSIFEKPDSLAHARTMITALSDKTHLVYSAICIIQKTLYNNTNQLHTPSIDVQFDCTQVQFIDISSTLLQHYLASKEWQGVAGGYRIQGLGALFVRSIQGNYSTVMGFPIPLFYKMIHSYFCILTTKNTT